MKEENLFFKLDKPVGRKQYILTALSIFGYFFVASFVIGILHLLFELNRYSLPFFIILWAGLFIVTMYITWINYIKRIWDLLGDKTNAIFYGTTFLIANFAISYISILKYLAPVLCLVVTGFLLFKKGKLAQIETQTENTNDVA